MIQRTIVHLYIKELHQMNLTHRVNAMSQRKVRETCSPQSAVPPGYHLWTSGHLAELKLSGSRTMDATEAPLRT